MKREVFTLFPYAVILCLTSLAKKDCVGNYYLQLVQFVEAMG